MNNPPDTLAAEHAKRVIRSERTLLGGLMHSGADRDSVFAKLAPSDFSTDAHQAVATAIRDLWATHQPIDLTTVCGQLVKSNRMSDLGGDAWVWVADLHGEAGTSALVDYHAGEVRDAARLRDLIRAAHKTINDCMSPTGPVAELIDQAAARIFALTEKDVAASRLRTSAEATNEALDEIDRRQRGEATPGVMTGLADLDSTMGGLPFGQMTILAARPSVGKTALSLQIARNAASASCPVLFASLEQRTAELATRALSSASGVCGQSLRLGQRLHQHEADRIISAADQLRALSFHYDDTPGQSALHILSTARRLKRQHGLGLVVIDYLQLVAPDDPRASRNDQLDGIARRLRELARELNVAVLALSQLSRDCEKQNRRPRLSDLRDSGALEQHADAVMMLHRPERSAGEVDPVELGIEKQRNGPTGLVNLHYRRRVLTFENAAMEFPA